MMTTGNFLGFLEIRDRAKAIAKKNSVRRTPWPNLLLVFAWVGIIWISSPTLPDAQTVDLDLLDDVNTTWTPGHSVPRRLVEIGDRVLFTASDGVNPRSLWASDGTPDGTQIVGFGISDEYRNWSPQFANLGDRVFFLAATPASGPELWASDGTPEGTSMVVDIREGPESAGSNIYEIPYFAVAREMLFFPASTIEHGTELWVTDGTAAGTRRLTDVCPGSCSGAPHDLTTVGDLVFFKTVDDPLIWDPLGESTAVWRTDGTPEGTFEVLAGTKPRCMSAHQDRLLIGAYRGHSLDDYVEELWVADGEADGTVLIKEYTHPTAPKIPCGFSEFEGLTYFTAAVEETGKELWRTDGTPSGTRILKDVEPGEVGSFLEMGPVVNGVLTFTASDFNHGRRLWRTDGTADGTVPVADPCPGTGGDIEELETVFGDKVLFRARDCENGYEPWVSDATEAGTYMLANLGEGSRNSSWSPSPIAIDNHLIMAVSANPEGGLWITDLSREGTRKLVNAGPGDYIQLIGRAGGEVLFSGYRVSDFGREPWITDGTEGRTRLLMDITSTTASSSPQEFASVGRSLFFVADDGVHGFHLRRSDGFQGSSFVSDGWDLYLPTDFVEVNGDAWFRGQKETLGSRLWKSDGTEEGTIPLDHLCEGGCDRVSRLFPWGDRVAFSGGPDWRPNLYVSDGTAEGTVVLEENLGLTCYLAEHPCIVEMDDGFVFSGTVDNLDDDTELWFSDGTPDGTRLVKDLRENYSSLPRSFTRVGDLAFFIAAGTEGGTEVWRTDGTAEATFMVKDIYTGTSWHRPTELTAHGSLLYFVAYDGQAQGYQLWVSDGTEDGTMKVVEEPLDPRQLISHSDGLYFLTRPDRHEQILWRTDGSPEGTVAVISFRDATAKLGVIGDNLYLVTKFEDQTLAVWRIRAYDDAELVIRDHGRWGYEFRRLVSHGRSLIFDASGHTFGNEPWRIFEVPEPRSTGGRVGGP